MTPRKRKYPSPTDMTEKGEQLARIVDELADRVELAETPEELEAIVRVADHACAAAVKHRLRAERALRRLMREVAA